MSLSSIERDAVISHIACHSHEALGRPQGEQQSNASHLSARGSAMAPMLLLQTTLVEPT